jgi:hypothetical protein
VSTPTLDVLLLAVFLVLGAGFFYLYVAGVVNRERPLSRAAALACLVSGALAVVFLVRVVL